MAKYFKSEFSTVCNASSGVNTLGSPCKLKEVLRIPPIPVNEGGEVLWEEAYYTLGISDNRGLKGNIILKTTSSAFEATPGLTDNDLFLTGISFPVNIMDSGDEFPFTLNLNLAGSESLNFAPVGKTTEVMIQSQWNSP